MRPTDFRTRIQLLALMASCAFLSCGDNLPAAFAAPPPGAVPKCNQPQKITAIYKDFVYDLSGYQDVVGVSSFNLFDENAMVDPTQSDAYRPQTSPHPPKYGEIYFKGKGSRIVADLRIPYRISDIYIYDHARTVDSIWVYTGTMQNWKLKAAFTTKGDVGLWGWRKFTVNDSSRFVMFRFSSYEAEVTEAVMYGCPLGTIPGPPPATYNGPRLPAKMMKEFLGVNCYQGTDIRYMQPFYYSREYVYNSKIDVDTVNQVPNIKYNIVPTGWWNNGTQDYVLYDDSITRIGNKLWYSFLGMPKWLEQKGYDGYDRPISKIGMDTEDPMSYDRHSNMFWNMAAAYGTTKVDTNQIQALNEHRFSGRNVMTLYENGNESDAYWAGNKYCNPLEYFALSSADYDGNEGKMGSRHGIKNADPKSELMMAGFTSFDVNRLRILKFLCNTLRKDSQFLWKGGIQYHYYSTNGKGKHPGEIFSSATAGITPEEDSLRQRLMRAREETYRIQPGVECFLGEYGFDKARGSKVSVPLVPGFNQAQSQGIMLVRAINLIAFSGFDRYIIYWVKDTEDENNPTYFLTSGILKQVEPGQRIIPYPAWFYISTFINWLGNYVPEKVINEKGNVWLYKYRNKLSPDSAAYFIYCPTHNGTKVDQYDLKVGHVEGNAVTEISLKDQSVTGEQAGKAVNNGSVKIDVGEVPKMILVKEKK